MGFRGFVLGACLAILFTTSFPARGLSEDSNSEYTKKAEAKRAEIAAAVEQVLADFSTPSDNKSFYRTVEKMSLYPYAEVVEALLLGIEAAAKLPSPNLDRLSAMIRALGKIGPAAEVPRFRNLYIGLIEPMSHMGNFKQLIQEPVGAAIENMANNLRLVPSYLNIPREIAFYGDFLKAKASKGNPESFALIKAATHIVTDSVRKLAEEQRLEEIFGREKEAQRVLDVLLRIRGRLPVLVGAPKVGKSAVIDRVAEKIVSGRLPEAEAFQEAFANAEVLRITPDSIDSDFKKIVESINYFEGQHRMEVGEHKPIIIFLDNFHDFRLELIKEVLAFVRINESTDLRVIAAADSNLLAMKLKHDPEVVRALEQIGVEEFSAPETTELLKRSWVKLLEKTYKVKISSAAVEAAVKVAPVLKPDVARPESAMILLQDVVIGAMRTGKLETLQEDKVYEFASQATGIPSNPFDPDAFSKFVEGLRERLNQKVVGQNQMVEALLGQYSQVLSSSVRKPKVLMLMGTTGVGKTYLAQSFTDVAFQSSGKFFQLNGPDLSDGQHSLWSIFGAPNGIISSDKTPGTLMEFLDDPSRGKFGGVILIDEAEKMAPDAWKRFMEIFDTGVATGGDGKKRYLNKHIIILTSNRGATLAFPPTVKTWTDQEIQSRTKRLRQSDLKAFFMQATGGEDKFRLPPEVVNRIDAYVLANPISIETAKRIGQLEVEKFKKTTLETYRVDLEIAPDLVERLALVGFDTADGARHIARQVQSYLSDALLKARTQFSIKGPTKLTLGLNQDPVSRTTYIDISEGTRSLRVDAPDVQTENPLDDPRTVEKLIKLESVMKERVIGQNVAVKSIAQAVTARYGNHNSRQPLSLFLIGTTGTGKTEIGKALAQALYDSPDRAAVIPLGGVKTEVELGQVFGSGVGYSGHTEIRAFEQALIDNPEGGVIILDEASNMGGNDRQLKEALFKKFYNILDEGRWTSTATNKTYDLSKYTLLFTGNDGDAVFRGISSDDLRITTWKKLNTRDMVRTILRENGVPEPLIARFADVILFKPNIESERIQISKKLIDDQIARFEKQHKGVKVIYDERLLQQMAKTFFSHDLGGRSLRNITENRFGSVLTQALLVNGYDSRKLDGLTLHLAINDNLREKPYRTSASPERKVEAEVTLVRPDKTTTHTRIDVTEYAAAQVLMSFDEARLTAYHEAGHALVNDPNLTDTKLAYITIVGGDMGNGKKYLGYARYEDVPLATHNYNRESMIARVAQLYAGRVAQEIAGYPPDSGWRSDYDQIRKIIERYIIEFGLEAELVGVPVRPDGTYTLSQDQQRIFDIKAKAIMKEGEALARAILEQYWGVARSVAAELLKKGAITGDRFYEVFDMVTQDGRKHRTYSVVKEVLEKRKKSAESQGKGPSVSGRPGAMAARSLSRSCVNMFKFMKPDPVE